LYLEKLRFKDRLNIVYNIRTYDFFVPSLTIQPIVENSVKYGVGQKEEGGTVTLSTWEENDCYKIKVEDDGVGFNPYETQSDGRMHIGIDNVKNRLAAMCKGTMTIDSKKGEGTIVVITIPKGENHENISGR
jgi:two-component system LytT family sensor kinase